jgi:hypothetical protein
LGNSRHLRLRAQAQQGKKEGKLIVNLNQLSIIGFVGNHAKTKFLPIGTPVVKFSIATKKSWKREKKEWKGRRSGTTLSAMAKALNQ